MTDKQYKTIMASLRTLIAGVGLLVGHAFLTPILIAWFS